MAILPGAASAASFQILEQSPALQGTSFAGTASSAQDASTVFFNPAAMTRLEGSHLSLGGNLIMAEADFDNDGSENTGGGPLQGSDGKTDETGFVPNLYYVRPINERWTFGFGINAPFGLASSYDKDWVGRYHATDSELQLLNINPTFAYRATDRVSVAVGINYQRIDATLEQQVDSFTACVAAGGAAGTCAAQHGGGPGNADFDSSAKIEGDDEDFTLDLSVLFEVNDRTTVGAAFRQGGDFTLEGDATFNKDDSCNTATGGPAAAFCEGALDAQSGDIEAGVDIPDVLTFSVSHRLNNQLTLHGDLAWTKWSSIDKIEIDQESTGNNVSTLDLDYDDTMRYAFGATWSDGGPWTWRGGIAIDEAPQTDPEFQTPRVPDEDRTWLSAGFNYAFSNDASIDFGFTHIMVDDPEINNTTEDGKTLTGDYDAEVNILAVQGNWTF
jgi:long-chain fatty acid transport protein